MVIGKVRVYDFDGDAFDEVETKDTNIDIYYLRLSSQDERRLKIEIEVEGSAGIWFYIIGGVIIAGVVIIIGVIIITLYYMYCKRRNPFQSQEWISNSDDRYNKIISETTEEKYDEEKEKYEERERGRGREGGRGGVVKDRGTERAGY